jgi:hypothetical protein
MTHESSSASGTGIAILRNSMSSMSGMSSSATGNGSGSNTSDHGIDSDTIGNTNMLVSTRTDIWYGHTMTP